MGEVEVGTFSVEKILALKPDFVLMADWQYKALDSDLEPLEQAGIPVVVVDYLAQTVNKHMRSTEIIGQLTGQEAKAKALNDEYKALVKDIQDRVAKATLPKPKVYVEFGNKGPAEHSFTFGKSMWGAMINLVGGDNIAKQAVEFYSPINPELVVAAKPDVILITGHETELKKNPNAMVAGFNIEEAEARKRLAGFAARPGWSELPAPLVWGLSCELSYDFRWCIYSIRGESGLSRAFQRFRSNENLPRFLPQKFTNRATRHFLS